MSSVDEALGRAEELLGRLNARREELEALAGAEDIDADAAVEMIGELAELAKQIEAELSRARAIADVGGDVGAGQVGAGPVGAGPDAPADASP